MIDYRDSVVELSPSDLHGFFVGWSNPPSPEKHLEILQGSSEVLLAVDSEQEKVVGFITAITDGVLSAYVPLFEVLPSYRNRGIGSELVRRLFSRLSYLYMIDVVCDPPLTSFNKRFGMSRLTGMVNAEFNSRIWLEPSRRR